MDPITQPYPESLLRHAEPWFQLGARHAGAGDTVLAAYCYYLALEMQPHRPSREALRQLGYLSLDRGSSRAYPYDSKEEQHGF